VTAAREGVDQKTVAAQQSREELAEAQEALVRAEQELAEARAGVGVHATDEVLFREVQTRLLDDEQLESLAIAARVEKGVVTLSGEAVSREQRERAAELAAEIPGILGVDNRIAIVLGQAGRDTFAGGCARSADPRQPQEPPRTQARPACGGLRAQRA
jgi:osmotically-inducible protein OsmY